MNKASLGRLLARLPVGVVSLSPKLRIEYINPAARIYLGGGASAGSLMPDPWPRFSLRKFASRLFEAAPPPRQLVDTSTRLLQLDGIPAGATSNALLLLQDVTSRERRRRAEQAFVSNAAHELRTPIAAISSALEVLQRGAKEDVQDRDLFLGHIERESDRLGRLADALLLLARIQTGQATPTLDLVELGPLLDDIAAAVRPHEGVAVRVECPPGVTMLADADLLRQAVSNLALNAARHTHKGHIVLVGRDLGHVSEIEVRDTGSGIEEAQQVRVFDRFYRAQRRAGDGFGLGLAISQEIAHALGGTLMLESKVGKGTNVRLHVPSARLVRT